MVEWQSGVEYRCEVEQDDVASQHAALPKITPPSIATAQGVVVDRDFYSFHQWVNALHLLNGVDVCREV